MRTSRTSTRALVAAFALIATLFAFTTPVSAAPYSLDGCDEPAASSFLPSEECCEETTTFSASLNGLGACCDVPQRSAPGLAGLYGPCEDQCELLNGHAGDCIEALECYFLTPTHVGTPGNDTIYGTQGPDIIFGLGGDDRLFGLGGEDIICGGDGDDRVDGGSGTDLLFGNNDDDRVYGRNGDDLMFGGWGDDYMAGARGYDLMFGGWGEDRMFGQFDSDLIFGGPDDDFINAGRADDFVSGDGGDDTCVNAELALSCELP